MRLNKYIAHSGVCSRRKADQLIGQGQVTVNGQKAECGYDVKDGDEVSVAGRIIRPEKRLIYYILNKPEGYITSVDDEQGRQTVLDLMPDIRERIYPVGRLDYNTSGMLIMTNDGDLAYKLTSPHKDIFKTYVAEVAGLFLYAMRKSSGAALTSADMSQNRRKSIFSASRRVRPEWRSAFRKERSVRYAECSTRWVTGF